MNMGPTNIDTVKDVHKYVISMLHKGHEQRDRINLYASAFVRSFKLIPSNVEDPRCEDKTSPKLIIRNGDLYYREISTEVSTSISGFCVIFLFKERDKQFQ